MKMHYIVQIRVCGEDDESFLAEKGFEYGNVIAAGDELWINNDEYMVDRISHVPESDHCFVGCATNSGDLTVMHERYESDGWDCTKIDGGH